MNPSRDSGSPKSWLCSATLLMTLSASGALAVADGSGPVITRQQIEADWLRQDIVRNLPPSPRDRSTGKQMKTWADAAGGCDGIKDGTYGFHTNIEDNPWWQVDLGESKRLDRIVIFNRCDGNVESRAARLKLLLTDDGKTWREAYQHDGTAFLGHKDGKPLVVPAGGATARFVRLQLPGRQCLHLDEVEVYAVGEDRNVALRQRADQSSTSQWSKRPKHQLARTESDAAGNAEPTYPAQQVVERGLALAESLRQLGANTGPHVQTLQHVARALDQLPAEAAPSARRELYFKARWAQRGMSLANPLLDFDALLLVKRIPGTFTHMSDQYYGWWSRPGGGLYVLDDFKTDSPRVRCLTESLPPGTFLRPDLSHDGRKVLFAYCKYHPGLREEKSKLDKNNVPEDAFYHLYEMNLDATGLRRLTRGTYDDFDGRYLPGGEIVFLSTRRGQYVQYDEAGAPKSGDGAQPDCYVRCGGGPSRPVAVYTLHVIDADGSHLRPISPFGMFEWTPSVDNQGRILYARWDYVDRWNMPYMSLWSTLPDGTGTQAVFGNYTTNPHCMFEARSIPGSEKLIFTASGHHANTGGSLVLLDYRQAVDGPEAMARLTPEVAFPETEGWPMSYFANPYPLSEDHYLVAWSDQEMIGWPGPAEPENAFGIYLFDAFGNLTLLYRDPAISAVTPLPVQPRRSPPQTPSLVDRTAEQEGRMLVLDVYQGLDGIPRGTVRRLRLVGIPVKTHPTMNFPEIGMTRDDPGKCVLGTIPVEKDGSAYFRLPSGVPLFLQALDAEGKAVQTMRSATYVQPGETRTCIGCHESRSTAPPDRSVLALRREPSKIVPGPEGSWPVDYATLVQPDLDAHCTECHRPGTDGEKWDLTTDKSYATLTTYGKPSLHDHILARYREGRSVPGACASSASPLVKFLKKGHHDAKLPPDAWRRLYTWLDTYGQRQGAFGPDQDHRLQQLKRRMTPLLATSGAE